MREEEESEVSRRMILFVIHFVIVLWIMPRLLRARYPFPSILLPAIGFSCCWITTNPPYRRLSACGSIIQLIRGLSYCVVPVLFKEVLLQNQRGRASGDFCFRRLYSVLPVASDSRRGAVFLVVWQAAALSFNQQHVLAH